jgi:hypothetical protein
MSPLEFAHPTGKALREQLELGDARLDAPDRAQLRAVLDRDLTEVAVDVEGDRPHIASSDSVDLEMQRAKRHRRIRALSTTGQVAGAASE